MKKSQSILASLAFVSLAVVMFIALSSAVLPAYSDHGRSMVVGTLAYIFMSGIVIFASQKSKQLGIAGVLASLTFIGAHILIEASLFSTIGLASVTNPFGYAALTAFVLAGVSYVMSKLRVLSQLTLYINGFMTTGITLVYYHVASLAPVRGSLLFFIPFTLFLVWTVAQYGVQVSQAVKTRRQTQAA
ncbi:hypothetical protein ACO1PF_04800 [Alkalibacterium sp. f15]|uniref:hypothetical protein n=1 Tax=Alkalibacterium sp. f15 TaxID=3414029 RepID=UPI003BF8DF2D